ncbi:hypothetical protein ALC57_14600 [Trachymyrmex cornetzi]|uniref:Uncharacterized protein n=1 Tax=Trachymyrmex cornetzi TaxID=471704 RepID=A0A151IYG1_9HYME|nr:hypothetical protein ALC57_14600 [Trachymyrmex cornetzi]
MRTQLYTVTVVPETPVRATRKTDQRVKVTARHASRYLPASSKHLRVAQSTLPVAVVADRCMDSFITTVTVALRIFYLSGSHKFVSPINGCVQQTKQFCKRFVILR